jgi:anti-sigma B factor antagonist
MAPLLQSATTPTDGNAIVTVRGDIDCETAGQLWQYLSYLVGQGHHHIVLDLGGMVLIDSAGVEVLARVSAWTRRKGGELVLRSVNLRFTGAIPRPPATSRLLRSGERRAGHHACRQGHVARAATAAAGPSPPRPRRSRCDDLAHPTPRGWNAWRSDTAVVGAQRPGRSTCDAPRLKQPARGVDPSMARLDGTPRTLPDQPVATVDPEVERLARVMVDGLIERLAAEPAVPAASLLDNLAEQLQQAANLRRLNVRRRLPGSTSAGSSPATPRRAAPRTAPGGSPQH